MEEAMGEPIGLALRLKWLGVGETLKLVLKSSCYSCALYRQVVIGVLAWLTFPVLTNCMHGFSKMCHCSLGDTQ